MKREISGTHILLAASTILSIWIPVFVIPDILGAAGLGLSGNISAEGGAAVSLWRLNAQLLGAALPSWIAPVIVVMCLLIASAYQLRLVWINPVYLLLLGAIGVLLSFAPVVFALRLAKDGAAEFSHFAYVTPLLCILCVGGIFAIFLDDHSPNTGGHADSNQNR